MRDMLFDLGSALVMPFWLLMILAPRWRWTARLVASPLIVLGPALLYAAFTLPAVGELLPALARPDLATIATLLGRPEGAFVAWMHFLAFDLFVGRWVFLDARERRMPAWVTSPVLVVVLMFGPIGLLVHLAARQVWPARATPVSA